MKRFSFITLFFLLCIFYSCKQKNTDSDTTQQPFCLSDTMQHMIAIDSAGLCKIQDEIHLTGEVNFDDNNVVKIFPRSGGQVVECKVSLGDKVEAGQTLAVIKSADIAGNYADLTQANADIAIAKRELDNESSLYNNGIASEKDYEEAKDNYNKILAEKTKLQSLININGGNNTASGGTYTLASPISGYIVEKNINAGNFIREDAGDNLFTISNLKDVWVLANVFETDIPRIQNGLNVSISTLAYPDKIYSGTIDKSSEVLDPVNKVMKVRVRLQNPGMELKPGMFANVVVTHELDSSAVCIPSGAVIDDNGDKYVVVYNSNCDLKVQPVNILQTTGDKTYIASGLQRGQKVITKNAILLYSELAGE